MKDIKGWLSSGELFTGVGNLLCGFRCERLVNGVQIATEGLTHSNHRLRRFTILYSTSRILSSDRITEKEDIKYEKPFDIKYVYVLKCHGTWVNKELF